VEESVRFHREHSGDVEKFRDIMLKYDGNICSEERTDKEELFVRS
jgi:hypothetical protein